MSGGIQGLDKLMKKYGTLQTVADQSVKKAVAQSIKTVQASAVLLCPVNDGELRQSIRTKVGIQDDKVVGSVYTNKEHGAYVEFGTGPKGAADHSGISPVATPAYSQSPWWIHESQIDKETAERYHMFALETKDGIFYQTSGQAAQPFMYPALKNNEERVTRNFSNHLSREIRKAATNG